MASKDKEKEKALRKRQWDKENESIQNIWRTAPYKKALVRHRGCDLGFYDYLDSFEKEFELLVTEAKKTYPCLMGIHEVDDELWSNHSWDKLGYGDYEQVIFEDPNLPGEYGKRSKHLNPKSLEMAGFASAFIDREGTVRAAISMKRKPHCQQEHKEFLYVAKIMTLCHELGHVHDYFHGINFDIPNKKANIIEAEVFANIYGLDKLAARGHRMGYDMLFEALQTAAQFDDYMGTVGKLVMERTLNKTPANWLTFYNQASLTDEERRLLGPEGVRALTT
jgi:hypothetical protein